MIVIGRYGDIKIIDDMAFFRTEKETYPHSTEDYKEEIEEVIMVIKNEVKLINNETIDYNNSLKDYIREQFSSI